MKALLICSLLHLLCGIGRNDASPDQKNPFADLPPGLGFGNATTLEELKDQIKQEEQLAKSLLESINYMNGNDQLVAEIQSELRNISNSIHFKTAFIASLYEDAHCIEADLGKIDGQGNSKDKLHVAAEIMEGILDPEDLANLSSNCHAGRSGNPSSKLGAVDGIAASEEHAQMIKELELAVMKAIEEMEESDGEERRSKRSAYPGLHQLLKDFEEYESSKDNETEESDKMFMEERRLMNKGKCSTMPETSDLSIWLGMMKRSARNKAECADSIKDSAAGIGTALVVFHEVMQNTDLLKKMVSSLDSGLALLQVYPPLAPVVVPMRAVTKTIVNYVQPLTPRLHKIDKKFHPDLTKKMLALGIAGSAFQDLFENSHQTFKDMKVEVDTQILTFCNVRDGLSKSVRNEIEKWSLGFMNSREKTEIESAFNSFGNPCTVLKNLLRRVFGLLPLDKLNSFKDSTTRVTDKISPVEPIIEDVDIMLTKKRTFNCWFCGDHTFVKKMDMNPDHFTAKSVAKTILTGGSAVGYEHHNKVITYTLQAVIKVMDTINSLFLSVVKKLVEEVLKKFNITIDAVLGKLGIDLDKIEAELKGTFEFPPVNKDIVKNKLSSLKERMSKIPIKG